MTTSENNNSSTDITGNYFIAHWYVQPKLNKISDNKNIHVIEPRLIEVLTYLAQRPQQLVSRKELIEALWHGQVSDGAVNRVIAKLRKYLGDNTETPEYIKTVAKQGYQLIAPVTFSSENPVKKSRSLPLILTMIVVLFLLLYQYIPVEGVKYSKTTVHPLTSQKGNESGATFSKDGKWLAYTHQKDLLSPLQLYIKSSHKDQIIQLTTTDLNISAPSFSSSAKSIAYFEKNSSSCRLVVMNLNNTMKPLTTTEVAKCDASVHFSTLTWSIDDEKLIYTDRKSSQHPYLIQQLTLATGRIQSLSQVPDSFYGDYSLALSNDGKKLAFLRSKYWDNSELYIMDMASLVIKKEWQFDFLVWSISFLDNKTLIYSDGKSPSNLYQLDIGRQKIDHLYSSTGFIFNPKKANNQNNIVYNQVNFEVDIWRKDLVNKNLKDEFMSRLNSSFIDEKPVISHDEKSIAFLSNRRGELRLWVKNKNQLFPIKSIRSSTRLDSYLWLADHKNMIIETGDNKLLLVDTQNDQTTSIKTINDISVHPSTSKDSQWLYYSSDKNGDWQIWRQLLATQSTPELVTPQGGYNGKESFDGSSLIFTKYQTLGLWKMNLETRQESLIIQDLPRRTQFKVCQYSLFYSKEEKTMTQIWQYIFATKQTVLVLESPIAQQVQYDLNESCSKMVYSIWQGESDIMLLKSN